MHSRTDPRYFIVDRDGSRGLGTGRGAFRMESVIRSDLLPVSALCFDLGEVVDERGRNRSPRRRFLHLLSPVSTHVEGTGAVANNEVGQPKVGLQVMMIFNWLPLE